MTTAIFMEIGCLIVICIAVFVSWSFLSKADIDFRSYARNAFELDAYNSLLIISN